MAQFQEIRQRDTGLVGRLLDIWESAVVETHSFLSPGDIEALKPEVAQAVGEIEGLYCYCEDETILGFLGIDGQKIEMLFVDAAARGKGIGKQLLHFAIGDRGARYVDVNEQNTQGVGFYTHMGFHVIQRSALDGQGRPFPILHLEK